MEEKKKLECEGCEFENLPLDSNLDLPCWICPHFQERAKELFPEKKPAPAPAK
jgi:hypothetical protein